MGNALLARHSLETANHLPDEQACEVLDAAAFVARWHRAIKRQDLQSAQLSALADCWTRTDTVITLRQTMVAKVTGRVDQTTRAHCVQQRCHALHRVT